MTENNPQPNEWCKGCQSFPSRFSDGVCVSCLNNECVNLRTPVINQKVKAVSINLNIRGVNPLSYS